MMSADSQDLYRIQGFGHLVDLFESRSIYLASPSRWEDPFEKVLVHKRSNALFAQCWCKKAVSDAMWRIYSPDRTAIRVRTNRSKLNAAAKAAEAQGSLNCFVKDVEYDSATKLTVRIMRIARALETNCYDPRCFRVADPIYVELSVPA